MLVKCDVCEERLDKENIYRTNYTTLTNKIGNKKGHENCIKNWYSEHCELLKLREDLIYIFDIPYVTKQMYQRIYTLHKDFNYDIIRQAVSNKSDVLCKHFIDKGYNYCHAIIENETVRVHSIEKQRQKENERITKQNIDLPKQTEYIKQDNRDISDFLDD